VTGRMNRLLKGERKESLWFASGLFILAGIWQAMSLFFSPLVLPSPMETLESLLNLLTSGDSRRDFYVSAYRVLTALIAVIVVGTGIGVVSGFKPRLESLLKPVQDILIAIPPVALIMLVIFLFGSGSPQTIMVAGALVFPLIYGNTVAAVRTVDRDLLEMTGVFNVSGKVRLRDIYLPSVIFSSLPNILLAAGLMVRIVVMAEVIVGVTVGIGDALIIARVNLAAREIFAWMLVMVAVVLIIEGVLLYTIKKYLLRWQVQG